MPPRVYAPASPLTTRSPPLRPAPLAPTAADVACHQRLRPLPQRQWSPCHPCKIKQGDMQINRLVKDPCGGRLGAACSGDGEEPLHCCACRLLSSPRAAARVRTRSRPDAEARTLCLPRLRPLIASNSTSTSSVREKGERGHRTPPTSMRQRRSMVAPLHSNPLAPSSGEREGGGHQTPPTSMRQRSMAVRHRYTLIRWLPHPPTQP